jgi:hypothetical protein
MREALQSLTPLRVERGSMRRGDVAAALCAPHARGIGNMKEARDVSFPPRASDPSDRVFGFLIRQPFWSVGLARPIRRSADAFLIGR